MTIEQSNQLQKIYDIVLVSNISSNPIAVYCSGVMTISSPNIINGIDSYNKVLYGDGRGYTGQEVCGFQTFTISDLVNNKVGGSFGDVVYIDNNTFQLKTTRSDLSCCVILI